MHIYHLSSVYIVHYFRLKNFTFKTRNFDLELPKAMLLADVTIRVMYLSLDFLSPLSASYHCPTIPPPTPHDVPVSPDPQQQQEDITDDNVSLSSHDNDGGRNSATKTPNSLKPPSSRVCKLTCQYYMYMDEIYVSI